MEVRCGLRIQRALGRWTSPINGPLTRNFKSPNLYASNIRFTRLLHLYNLPKAIHKPRSPWKPDVQVRHIFIQTEATPNDDARKFLPNCRVLPSNIPNPFLEYMNLRSTVAAPYPSPLASQLMSVDGVKSIFYGPDFITVTKASDADWAHLNPEIFSLITETVNSGESIVNTLDAASKSTSDSDSQRDSLEAHENDSEVVGMIKELLETRIRPAIQDDGGDIEFRGFEHGRVFLKLRGACRTCDSSTVTLKNGIENMLMHYIEEVKGIEQVLDEEEEVAIQEFAKFEDKLKQQRSSE